MKRILLFIIPIALLFVACHRKNMTNLLKEKTIQLEVSRNTIVVSKDKSETSFQITTEADWHVSVPDTVLWISVSPKSGSGNESVLVTIDENKMDHLRSASLTLKAGNKTAIVTVLQSPAGEQSLAVYKDSVSGGHDAFSDTLLILTSQQWTVSGLPDWISVAPSAGEGTSQIIVSVDANKGEDQRMEDFEISTDERTQKVAVTQAGHPFSVWLTTAKGSYTSFKDTLVITSPVDWTIGDLPLWITASSKTGTGDAKVMLSVKENVGTSQRSADIIVKTNEDSKTVTITQPVNPVLNISKDISLNRKGHYLDLTNGGDFMEVSAIPAFKIQKGASFSVSFKVKVGSGGMPSSPRIFYMGDPNNSSNDVSDGYEMFLDKSTGHLQFNVKDDNGTYLGNFKGSESADVMDGAWHHVVAVYDYDTKTSSIYVDGTKEGIHDFSSEDVGSINPSDKRLFIGDWISGGWNFNGDIDDFSVWNKALTTAEVYADAANYTLSSDKDNLVIGWDFDGAADGIYSSLVSSQLKGGAHISK